MSEIVNEHRVIKRFSYDPLKVIMKYSRFDRREQMARLMKRLRIINTLLPYHFDEVTIAENTFCFKIGKHDRVWHIYPLAEHPPGEERIYRNQDPEDSPSTDIQFRSNDYQYSHNLIGVKKADAMAKLIREYFNKGSTAQVVNIFGTVPTGLEGVCLKAEVIKMDRATKEEFLDWMKIMDEEALKEVKFLVCESTMSLLQLPMVQACERLRLQFPYYHPIELNDWFVKLHYHQIHVIHLNFPKEKFPELIRRWINYRRSLGTSFSLGVIHYTDVLDVFDLTVDQNRGRPSKFPEINSFLCHCVAVPIDEYRELVVFGEPKRDKWPPFQWNLRIEIMQTGTTVPKRV